MYIATDSPVLLTRVLNLYLCIITDGAGSFNFLDDIVVGCSVQFTFFDKVPDHFVSSWPSR